MHDFDTIKDLHFKLLNILSLIFFGGGSFYCFCNKYSGCEKKCNQEKQCCALCHIEIEFESFVKQLDKNRHNLDFLQQFALKLYPFLEECYQIDGTFIVKFCCKFSYSSFDW